MPAAPMIYLDGFATLPLAPEAREAMLRAWSTPGNAGSPHAAGEQAARCVAEARARVAAAVGASPSEMYFTSGATEANNLALLGVATAAIEAANPRRKIVVSAVEHKSVLEPASALVRNGFTIEIVPVDSYGRLDLSALRQMVDDTTLLVSVMAANNETGIIQPVKETAAIARSFGALVHSDASQALGKVALDVLDLDVDYLSLSAHKCYGPMGIGALFVAAGAPRPSPLCFGGGQQAAVRPGTEPVPLIAGFAAAVEVAAQRLELDRAHGKHLVQLFETELASRQIRFRRVTGEHDIVPGASALALEGIDADALCTLLARTVQVSTGSACTSGQIRSSHVLEAMGYSSRHAREVVRVFFDRYKSDADAKAAAQAFFAHIGHPAVATGEVLQ